MVIARIIKTIAIFGLFFVGQSTMPMLSTIKNMSVFAPLLTKKFSISGFQQNNVSRYLLPPSDFEKSYQERENDYKKEIRGLKEQLKICTDTITDENFTTYFLEAKKLDQDLKNNKKTIQELKRESKTLKKTVNSEKQKFDNYKKKLPGIVKKRIKHVREQDKNTIQEAEKRLKKIPDYEKSIANLKKQIDELLAKTKYLSDENYNLRDLFTNTGLHDAFNSNKKLRLYSKSLVDEIHNLKKQLKTLEFDLTKGRDDHVKKLKEIQQQINAYKQKLPGIVNKRITKIKKENKEIVDNLTKKNQDAMETLKKLPVCEQQIITLNKQIKELLNTIKILQEENNNFKNIFANQDIQKAIEYRKELKLYAKKVTREAANLKKKLQAVENDLKKESTTLKESWGKIGQLEHELARLKASQGNKQYNWWGNAKQWMFKKCMFAAAFIGSIWLPNTKKGRDLYDRHVSAKWLEKKLILATKMHNVTGFTYNIKNNMSLLPYIDSKKLTEIALTNNFIAGIEALLQEKIITEEQISSIEILQDKPITLSNGKKITYKKPVEKK